MAYVRTIVKAVAVPSNETRPAYLVICPTKAQRFCVGIPDSERVRVFNFESNKLSPTIGSSVSTMTLSEMVSLGCGKSHSYPIDDWIHSGVGLRRREGARK